LWVDRLHHSIRFCCQKPEDIDFDRAFLFLPYTLPACPDAREGKQRLILIESEPVQRLALGLRIWLLPVFGEGSSGHNASAFDALPPPPVRRGKVADIGHAAICFTL